MARSGEVIENPVTGERMTFVKTASDTNGTLLELRLQLQPNAHNASSHVHPRQVERITVVEGELHLALGGEPERTLSAGETVTIGSGVPHYWQNRTGRLVETRIEYEPALNTEEFFETFFALGRAGRTDAAGVPGLLQNLAQCAALRHLPRQAPGLVAEGGVRAARAPGPGARIPEGVPGRRGPTHRGGRTIASCR